MNLQSFHIDPSEINVSISNITKVLGLDEDNLPDPYPEIIKTEMDRLADYDEIRGGIRIMDNPELDPKTNSFRLDTTVFYPGKQVMKYIKHSEKLVLFICTAGEAVSKRSSGLMKSGQMLEGYVCDVVGSLLVEEAINIIQTRYANKIREKGFKSTNRYSPGYCDWNVEEQHKLFKFFPPGYCGIRLTDSALMFPVKSVSGVFGIGREVKFHKYVCIACKRVNCAYGELKR